VEVNGVGNTGVTKEEPAAAPAFRVEVSGAGPQKIIPEPNVLDKFNSYTYQASIYLLTPTQFSLFQDGNRIIPDSQLLFQSGGKAAGTGNKFFDNDFYLDNITIETLLPGKFTNGAHYATDIKFTITEPMGITLLDRLKNAVAAQQTNAAGSWAVAQYLMKISFFGYDEKGNLVSPGTPVTAGATQNSKAVIVKYIPFMIKELNWSVGSKLVSYDFVASPIGQVTAGSSALGTITSDFQITATTVGELFGADPADSAVSAPPTASAAKKKTKTGLAGALNTQAEKAQLQSGFREPDTYKIVFVDAEDIRTAYVGAVEQFVNRKSSPMAPAATQSAQVLDSSKIPGGPTTRWSVPIIAGMSIVKILDLIIRNSTYITSKQITNNQSDGSTKQNSNGDPPMWYLITFSASPVTDTIDPMRNDFAYDMTYTITRYAIPNLHSDRFPSLKTFPGLHKEYKYWFTGENTSILDYSARFDSLYTLTTNGFGGSSVASNMSIQQSASRNDLWSDDKWAMKRAYAPRSSQAVGYGENNLNEGSANAAEYLYSPTTLKTSKIKIIGDPAWIQQGSVLGPINSNGFAKAASQGFLPDGTISFDTAQVLYEIAWQRPEDYNIGTGLADPYAKTFQKYGEREPLQSNIYQAIKVVNEFRNGQFEQTIDGTICLFNKPKGDTPIAVKSNETSVTNSRTQAQSATQSNAFGNGTNPSLPSAAAAASLTPAAATSTGTMAAPVLSQDAQNNGPNIPATSAEQYAAVDNARSPITEVPNIVPALPPAPVTSNGQTIGGYGFGAVLNSPPVLVPGAGRTSIDTLQAAAVNVPPYLTRRDP
jgi:hypothetical protein